MTMLNRLWALAEREALNSHCEPFWAFDPIGLILVRSSERFTYTSTPLNTSTFAHTGGDGVHFGLVDTGDNDQDNSPVVMTVPMAFDRPNVIVGDNLLEFLNLGCRTGYWYLEELAYSWARAIEMISNSESHPDWADDRQWSDSWIASRMKREKHLLSLLIQEFRLKPWTNVKQRLDDLQSVYLPLLEVQT